MVQQVDLDKYALIQEEKEEGKKKKDGSADGSELVGESSDEDSE